VTLVPLAKRTDVFTETGALRPDRLHSTLAVVELTGPFTVDPQWNDSLGYPQQKTIVIRQDATGGHSVSWGDVEWANGTPPSIDTSPGATTIVSLIKVGATDVTYGFVLGVGFA
jgi:hypothetical protein